MLAQNFMKPEALGISDAQLWALVKVLGMLERGELQHTRYLVRSTTNGFNMNHWAAPLTECGTVHCIGGWAKHVGGVAFRHDNRPDGLDLLFYPNIKGDWGHITTAQAATALRNYLTTGDPRWDEALA